MRIFKGFLLIIVFFIVANLYAFEIKGLKGYFYEQNFLISILFKDFPFQELVLALKKQKNPVLIDYEFEIYQKRLFLKDVLLYRDRYYQKLYYDPEKNLYYLEDNFSLKAFEKPEDVVLSIINLESYLLRYTLPPDKNSLKLKVKVIITYSIHLSDELKYTKKEHFKKIETEKIVGFDELLGKS